MTSGKHKGNRDRELYALTEVAKALTVHHVPGTGLGLPLARAIVEAHGGRIWAQSKVGQGTELYFSVPLPVSEKGTG